MNQSRPATSSQRLVSEIQLARIRLAKAESSLDSAREQSRVAKRRRKEAKQAARRARKQVKQAKADLQEAKQVLLAAEEKLALARQRAALARRRAKATGAAKTTVAGPGQRKKAAPPRRSRLGVSPATPAPRRVSRSQPKPAPAEPVALVRPADAVARQPTTTPRDLETPPAATASLPENPGPAPETEI